MTTNIAETLDAVARDHGPAIGLVEVRSGREVSFAELSRRSSAYARYLQQRGVRPGDRTMLMVRPSADFICLTFALFKLGAPVILIDPGMGYANLRRCIAGVSPWVLIGIPQALVFARLFRKAFATVRHSFCCGFSGGIFGPDISRAIARDEGDFPCHVPAADDLAAIIFTTGSTGPPKGVRFEHAIFAAQLRLIREYYGITAADVDQPAFPLFALFSTALGARAIIPDMDPTRPVQVNPARFIASINRHQVTYSFGSPALWNVVSRYCLHNKIVLPSLHKVLMAGAPVPGELLERVRAILPAGAVIHTPYGATESLPIVSMTGDEILTATWPLSRQGRGTCVGRALPGIEIKVIRLVDGVIADISGVEELPPGKIGEIIVRGDVVTRAYDHNEAETRLAKIRDGETLWHRMGDTGYRDAEGRLWFCGRKAHRVVTLQETLYTIPCEAIVNEHPDVYRSALVGIPSAAEPAVQEAVLIVQPHETSRPEAELLAEVRELAGRHPLTRDIRHFLIHRDFPVDIRHNAKIFREKLAVWAATRVKTA
ncbi:AMP-binding protein [Desulfoprunum benzoelyticum]|uniref:Acyl-coenzyme A synthetase/AMP-(Fatty) acid ligase n=1 Tax=Desulfoprunum benzoelyticum TaxID=1506996 RepID=A0A840UYM4_9BACT|nr:fatty acid CoA ligase family protein [Desulfoprunum benzoelyticum]MBB5346600.1 acyl-coenzyme A synthetase/AMP-(fatty) acid ligase [Desulfoprunum benzoelyticum]MBM9528871.1 AMP-binding protein [Desulfoprunum benzoelyticum]